MTRLRRYYRVKGVFKLFALVGFYIAIYHSVGVCYAILEYFDLIK